VVVPLSLRRIQDFGEFKLKARQNGIGADPVRCAEPYRSVSGTVNVSAVLERVKEPTQAGAVGDVLFHFLFKVAKSIGFM
jgi:hypothetical protein